jgi:hypothetical protein
MSTSVEIMTTVPRVVQVLSQYGTPHIQMCRVNINTGHIRRDSNTTHLHKYKKKKQRVD